MAETNYARVANALCEAFETAYQYAVRNGSEEVLLSLSDIHAAYVRSLISLFSEENPTFSGDAFMMLAFPGYKG